MLAENDMAFAVQKYDDDMPFSMNLDAWASLTWARTFVVQHQSSRILPSYNAHTISDTVYTRIHKNLTSDLHT